MIAGLLIGAAVGMVVGALVGFVAMALLVTARRTQ
jgi:uncharacterized membrane-anchored protein YhcB (DUF1043 family)